MLKKKTPKTIDARLKLTSQGETFTLGCVYRNLKQPEYDALVESATSKYPDSKEHQNAAVVAGLLDSWESEYDLSVEGLVEAEADRPMLIMALLSGFFTARQVERVKN